MNTNTQRALLITISLFLIAFVVVSFSFRAIGMEIKSMKPFVYRGGSNSKNDWYNYMTPLAKVVGRKYGIPWEAMVVQTALETGWGKSSLLRDYNNFGGIKAVAGDNSVNMATTEYINGKYVKINDDFAVFKTPYEGLIGYASFFHRYPRYSAALNYPKDPYQFIIEVKKAGYATDPNYVSKLHNLLNELKK